MPAPASPAEDDLSLEPEQLEEGLKLFEQLVQEDPSLREEFRSSVAQYFTSGQAPAPATPEGISAARRHLEWFLFERVSDPVRELPAEQLLERWRLRAAPELAAHQETFLESHAGIFAVTDVEPGKGAWLQDLAGLGQYPVVEAEASRLLAADDLIVGRLYPVGDSVYRISRSAGFFREPDLVRALEEDMVRLRRVRSHMVLRIAQRELEATFWGGSPLASTADPVGDARRSLASSGVPATEVQGLLEALAASPMDPANPTPGVGDALGRVLEQLAFHTDVDLGLARRQLLLAWQHLSAAAAAQAEEAAAAETGAGSQPAGASSPGEVQDVARAVAELDQRLKAGQDVGRSFDELERALGLDRIQDEEDRLARRQIELEQLEQLEEAEEEARLELEPELEGIDKAPDFPGVVGAMVEEFVWESEVRGAPVEAEQVELLRLFARLERGLGVFEELSRTDVMRFATFWLPESGALATADRAERAIEALERFCLWAEENHALPHLAGVLDKLSELRASLPRVAAANSSLEVAPSLGDLRSRVEERAGELFEFLGDLGQGRARVRDPRSSVHVLQVRPETTRLLEVGDRLRASRDDSQLVIHCCYPPQIAQVAPGRVED